MGKERRHGFSTMTSLCSSKVAPTWTKPWLQTIMNRHTSMYFNPESLLHASVQHWRYQYFGVSKLHVEIFITIILEVSNFFCQIQTDLCWVGDLSRNMKLWSSWKRSSFSWFVPCEQILANATICTTRKNRKEAWMDHAFFAVHETYAFKAQTCVTINKAVPFIQSLTTENDLPHPFTSTCTNS